MRLGTLGPEGVTVSAEYVATIQRALPLMKPAERAEAQQLLNELAPETRPPSTLAELRTLSDGFAQDMQPVCRAILAALHEGDLEALRDLRAMLPALLREVNASPVLSDLLAYQLGAAVLSGLQDKGGAR